MEASIDSLGDRFMHEARIMLKDAENGGTTLIQTYTITFGA